MKQDVIHDVAVWIALGIIFSVEQPSSLDTRQTELLGLQD